MVNVIDAQPQASSGVPDAGRMPRAATRAARQPRVAFVHPRALSALDDRLRGVGRRLDPVPARRRRSPVGAPAHGEAVEVMRQLKQTLDPKGILNPGKVLPD